MSTDRIKNLSSDELIKLCDEITKWKYVNGTLPAESLLNKLADQIGATPQSLEEEIIETALNRFQNVALLLLNEKPRKFFKSF